MTSSATEFKKLREFWQSQEQNNLVPCAIFRKRTLIENHISQPIRKSQDQLQLPSNATETLDPVEENTLNPVSYEEFRQKSLVDQQGTFREFKTELSIENQFQNPAIIITDTVSSSIESLNSELCIENGAELIFLNPTEHNELLNPVPYENFDQDFSGDKNKFLSPDTTNYDSISLKSHGKNSDGRESCSSYSGYNTPVSVPEEYNSKITTTNLIKDNSNDESFFDDDWLFQKNHIFVLSFAGKPIFSLHKHGYEDKMSSLFALIQCFISFVECRKDRILSIEAEGIKFVFLVRNALYLVAASRDCISDQHLKLQLREVYNRIGFLLTFASLNRLFEDTPGYDLRHQLSGNYKLISNQLTTKLIVSNNIFTLFTNSIRVLPLHPTSRSTITNIIQRKCSKISNLAFAVLIVEDQLVALVRLKKHTIQSSDIRLIFNLMECSGSLFKNINLWMLPICLPNFNKDCYLHAYISSISVECEAYLILLSYDRDMAEELSKAHREITKTLYGSNWFKSICQQIKNASQQTNGFNVGVIKIPELWHFLYMPKSSNHQLLCSKIIPPYTCLSEFKRLESIYRDLHDRIHNNLRPLELIFEIKEKEVAIALVTDTAELYAVFDPLVNNISMAKYYVDELVKWIRWEQEAYFIRKYPKF